ncbi:MAG: hypothetical protein GX176_01355 [Syntrophomonadaceae bacterium]|nr:hypothetical protein [Syntrophomonadaceae bacterium]
MENNLVSLNRVFLNLNNPAAQHTLVLTEGDILRGLVKDIDANGTVRVLIQGHLIEAIAEAKVSLGQNLHLLVEEVQPGRIILRILTPEALDRVEQANLASRLRELGITPNESNIRLASLLLEHQLPVNRTTMGQAVQVLQHLGVNTVESAKTAALAVKYNLPLNQALLERLMSFLKADNDFAQIYQQLSRMLGKSMPTRGSAVPLTSAGSDVTRYIAGSQPTVQPTNINADVELTSTPSAATPSSALPGANKGGVGTPEANQMQPMGTISETISTKQNLLLASADAGSQNASLEHQPSMKGTAISPNLTWPQSGDFGSILKLWSQIQLLLERTVIKGDTTALPIQGQLQQLLQSHPDLMQGWVLMENILKNAGSSDNQVLRDMQAIIRTLEHEISGQQILNTVGRFSAETTFPGIYLAFPLKLEQDHYTMCELRLNREGRQMSREDNSLQIAVSLDTPHMGIVLFHVLWRRAGTLDIRAVVEKDFVRDFFLKNWEELSGSLEQMGYRVNNLGIKVVDERTEIESLRPDLQMPAALKTRPISIDIII